MAKTKRPPVKHAAAKRKAPARPRPPANRPETQPSDPESRNYYYHAENAGTRVSYDNVLNVAAVWCCVRVIAETLAAMPWQVFRKLPSGGRQREDRHAVDWLLSQQPNPETVPVTFKETLAAHIVTWGNAYAEIERDNAGRPLWLWPLAPDRVKVARDDAGQIAYEVANYSYGREPTYLPGRDVLHVPGLGYDGLVGYSVVEMASRSIGLSLDLELDATTFWANHAAPSGVLEHPGTLSDPAKKHLEESWQKKYGGPRRRGRLAVLEEGMKFAQIGLPQRDAQFLETRTFGILEICRWFRVPPHKVFELGRATWANIESQEVDFLSTSIVPWALKFEQHADAKLFGQQQRGVYYTKFNPRGLLRGDSQARADYYGKMFGLGVLSPNEVRELEEMNPIGPDGDKRLVQVNQTTLEKIGEEPEPPPPKEPAQNPAGPAQEDDGPPQPPRKPTQAPADLAQIRAAVLPVMQDAVGRVLRREQHRYKDAARRLAGDAAAFQAWVHEFGAEHQNYARRALLPAAQGVVGLIHPDAGEAAVSAVLAAVVVGQWDESQLAMTAAHEGGAAEPWPDDREAKAAASVTDALILAALAGANQRRRTA